MADNFLVLILMIVLSSYIPSKTFGDEVALPQNQANKVTSEDQSRILQGLEAGRGLAEALANGDFQESLQKMATNLYGFLGVASPLVGIAISFIPTGDSPEMTFMKEKFEEVNNKLDILIEEFGEVKAAIDWNTAAVSYGVYERKIKAADRNLIKVFDNVGSAREHEIENFIIQYESDFDNSLEKLYDAMVSDDNVFSPNILDAVETQTKKHKRKFEQFSLGLIQLLIEGMKVKICYYAMKNWTTEHLVDDWDVKMITLKTKLEERSTAIADSYLTQLRADAEAMITRFTDLSNQALMRKLFDFMNEKYDWRYFFVAVYDDLVGESKHYMVVCGGQAFLHLGGRNTVIASQEKRFKSILHQSEARSLLAQSVRADVDNCRPGLKAGELDYAKALVQNAVSKAPENCAPNSLYLAVRLDSGFQSINNSGHRSAQTIKKVKKCCWESNYSMFPVCAKNWWNHEIMIFS